VLLYFLNMINMLLFKYLDIFFMEKMKIKLSSSQIKTEILSGITVALALVPEAVAFAFVATVNPLVALYAAFFLGLITALLGGRPGMISGATGALAVVMVSLVAQHGVEYLFATVVLMGALQMLVGVLNLGRLIRIVPHPVMLGFVNGLAIVIFLSQLGHFQVYDAVGVLQWMQGSELLIMLGLTSLTMLIIHFVPRISKIVPSPLLAIMTTFCVTYFFNIDTVKVGDMASISGGLPTFHFPAVPLNWDTLYIILPYSSVLAGVGLIESLLTLVLIDEVTQTSGDNKRECLAQGFANIVAGFFGGMGGCAMIGQSMINISSGARHRLSGVAAALFLLTFILFGAPVIEAIPLAALVGVMFMVVIGTFAWSSLQIMNKIPRADAVVIVLVSALTVIFDLAIAVVAGVVISALIYAWDSASHIIASNEENKETGEKIYNLYGSLFFASTASFRALFTVDDDPQKVIINFSHCRVWDHSALEALVRLSERYNKHGKAIRYTGLSQDCARLLERSGLEIDKVDEYSYQCHQVSLFAS
jgi:SulP family sulfate permease